MPKIAMLEGYRGIPSERGRALGTTAFCREFDDAMDRLKLAYQKALAVGVPVSDTRLVLAKSVMDRESGVWSTWVAWGDACANMVKEANARLLDVNSAIMAQSPAAIIPGAVSGQPTQTLMSTLDQTLGTVKWIVIGGAVLAGLVYLGPLISFGTRRLTGKRKFAGYRRRKR